MKKLLYIAPLKIDFSKPDGVGKKILMHINTFGKSFYTDLLFSDGKNILLYSCLDCKSKIISLGNSRTDILKSYKLIQEKYNYLYIRYPKSDYIFLKLLKLASRNKLKIVVEIPTYPYDREGLESIKGRLIKLVDSFFQRYLHKYVNRIITFSNDDYIFSIKTIKTVNGFDYEKIIQNDLCYCGEIHFIAVSSMYIVNGFERIIRGIAKYIKGNNSVNVIFDIVGDGPTINEYKKIVIDNNLEKNVVFHGKKFGEALERIYKGAHVGINSIAIHRQGLVCESTLKTREYVAYGLPIVSSSFVDALDDIGNNEFIYSVDADESDIDINLIVEFYLNLVKKYNKNLNSAIRNNGINASDIKITLKPIVDYFINEVKG